MAHTRIYNDKDRIKFNLGIDSDICKYILGEPGNGIKPYYFDDPFIRMQHFGGNISTNIVDVNSNLIGLTRKIDRNQPQNIYNNNPYSKQTYPNMYGTMTEQSRAIAPAWNIRDLEKYNWNYLHKNPQSYINKKLNCNIHSRILEKDNYKPSY